MLYAHAIDWNRASEAVSERRTAVSREVVKEGVEGPRMRSVEVICLLLRTPRGDNLSWHT
jgi:hypothetical protein